jgi:hypothetical protein
VQRSKYRAATAVLGWSSRCGIGNVKQFDSFLPLCPITFRNDVIPAGYNGKDEAVRHLNFSLKTALRGGKHLENTGLPAMPAIQQET